MSFLCIHVCMYVGLYLYMYVCMYVYACIHEWMCVFVSMNVYMFISMYAQACACFYSLFSFTDEMQFSPVTFKLIFKLFKYISRNFNVWNYCKWYFSVYYCFRKFQLICKVLVIFIFILYSENFINLHIILHRFILNSLEVGFYT